MDRKLGRKGVLYTVRPAAARVTNPRRKRKTNPLPAPGYLVVLYATKPGGARLKYLGHGKFGSKGRPMLFKTVADATLAGHILRDSYPRVLRGWTLKPE